MKTADMECYRRCHEDSPQPFCLMDYQGTGRILYANPAMNRLLGYSLRQGDTPPFTEHVRKALAEQGESSEEWLVSFPDTGKKAKGLCRRLDEAICSCFLTDMTDLMPEAKAPEVAVQRIYDMLPGAFFQCLNDESWTLRYGNDKLFHYLGYTREEFAERFDNKLAAIVYEEDRKPLAQNIEAQLRQGLPLINDCRVVCRDKSLRWISIRAEYELDAPGIMLFHCLFIDISSQKAIEEQLSCESSLMCKLTAEYTDICLWQYDIETDTLYNSENSQKWHGGEMVIPQFAAQIPNCTFVRADSLELFQALYRRIRAGEPVASADIWFQKDNDGESWCERITSLTVFDKSGKPIRAIGIGKNITEESNALLEKQKMDIALASSNATVFWEYDVVNHTTIQQDNVSRDFGVPRVLENMPQAAIDAGFVHPDSVDTYRHLYTSVDNGVENVEGDVCMFDAQRKRQWYHLTLKTLFEGGKPVRAVGWGVDITEYKDLEMRYGEEIQYLSAVQGNDVLGRFRANLTKNTVDSYAGLPNLLMVDISNGYADMARSIATLCAIPEHEVEYLRAMSPENLLSKFKKGEHECSIEYLRKMRDGIPRWVRSTAKLFRDLQSGDIICFIYIHDIDQKKTAEAILDRIADTDFDLLALLYLNRDLLHCVRQPQTEQTLPSAEVQYSTSIAAFVTQYIQEGSREEALAALSIPTIRERLQSGKPYTVAFTVCSEGKTFRKKWEFFYLDKGHSTIVLTRSDITQLFEQQEVQRENLRTALAQAEQANHAKSDFLSRMSHEIRTPMNAIIGLSALAAQNVSDPVQVSDCISKVGISARFLLSLINDILDMSRIESGKVLIRKEKFPFEELINSINAIIYEQAAAKGLDYDCVLSSFTDPFYLGDAMKLQQVLVNLLGNAIKFTPAGGKVQFIIHRIKTEGETAYLRFTVNDTGIGISEEFQKRMFDPFEQKETATTTPYGGTGLGLAICKNLVKLMHGSLFVNSIEGVGSEFIVELPLGICTENAPLKQLSANVHLEKLNVLVVDDDVVICEHTQAILVAMGSRAEWVNSGQKAIETVRARWEKKKNFDIILIDWKMPDMDGIEATRRIRSIVGPDVTIIVMTAYEWGAIEHEAKAAGVNMLLSKPLFQSSLTSTFERIYAAKDFQEERRPHSYDFTGRRILLVEDHILNVEVAKRLLMSKGAEVEVAENGLVALETFTTAPAGHFDAILMDIRMPVMDGLTATRSIRQLKKKYARTIPIIAMSANAFDQDVEKSRAAGMNEHLAKPIEPNLLFATLEKCFL